jgi:hypothetical protein
MVKGMVFFVGMIRRSPYQYNFGTRAMVTERAKALARSPKNDPITVSAD